MTPGLTCITGVGTVQGFLRVAQDEDLAADHGRRYLRAAQEVVSLVSVAAQSAWDMARVDTPTKQPVEVWLATFFGTGHISEYYAAELGCSSDAPLAPRAFPLFCLNSACSAASGSLGVEGAAVTLLGLRAYADVFTLATNALRTGRSSQVVCGVYDWPSPLVAEALGARGLPVTPWDGAACIFVIESSRSATERGIVPLAVLDGPGPSLPEHSEVSGLVPGLDRILWFARNLRSDLSADLQSQEV